jgi:ribose 5-phosphate isomerase A
MTDTGGAGPLDRIAARALELCADARVIGLGTGRAASAFVRALGAQARAGRAILGVPTSEASAELARQVGIPLAGLDEPSIDVTVDGADEVDPALDLIKGYGGALVRERIVAAASGRQIILVGSEKLVPVLGTHGRLPVEVVPFALPLVLRRLAQPGCAPSVRTVGGRSFVSDNGNLIVDCAIAPIADASAFQGWLRAVPGVVDTGLFLGTADTVLVGDADGIRELRRSAR